MEQIILCAFMNISKEPQYYVKPKCPNKNLSTNKQTQRSTPHNRKPRNKLRHMKSMHC